MSTLITRFLVVFAWSGLLVLNGHSYCFGMNIGEDIQHLVSGEQNTRKAFSHAIEWIARNLGDSKNSPQSKQEQKFTIRGIPFSKFKNVQHQTVFRGESALRIDFYNPDVYPDYESGRYSIDSGGFPNYFYLYISLSQFFVLDYYASDY